MTAQPVYVTTGLVSDHVARPCRRVTTGKVAGGAAIPVVVVSAAQIASGQFSLEGGNPMDVMYTTDMARAVKTSGEKPMPIYLL